TLNDQLIMDMEAILFDLRNQLETRIQNLENASPQNAIRQDNITVDHLEDRLKTVLVHQLKSEKQNVKAMGEHLTILNPQNVLKRGYALVEGKDGSIIENTRRAREAGELMLCFKDGSVEAEVKQEESWQRENIKPK
ncbi:MAG: exodeoxyribonuclease VII large subunit, partial [Eubacteriaceae bacterium]|nr:exodeoxyribonuclease VII large subunit [Eubacteriaceae bacterium]